jgi:sulfite dehydrogenase
MTFSVKGITMMDFRSIALAACVACAGMATATNAVGASDPTQYLPSTLPGYAKTQEKCLRCHTAEPMSYQPENAPRAYWESEVKRMKRIFKVKLDDSEMADIVDYMTKTYGNEKDGLVAAPKEAAKESAQPVAAAQTIATQLPAAAVPVVKPESVVKPAPVPAPAQTQVPVPEPAPINQSVLPNRRR